MSHEAREDGHVEVFYHTDLTIFCMSTILRGRAYRVGCRLSESAWARGDKVIPWNVHDAECTRRQPKSRQRLEGEHRVGWESPLKR